MRTFILNFIWLAGFALIVYGVYQVSLPWACVVLGSGMILGAVLNAFVTEYTHAKNKGN